MYDQRAPSMNQVASVNGRVLRIHSEPSRRVISAPIANANGTANSVYPEYSIGGWIIMLGCRSSGLSPEPSSGAIGSTSNGDSKKTSSEQKNAPKPSSTAVAHGATSRRRRRVRKSTRLDQIDSMKTHRRSEPSCEDQGAAIL